MIIKKAIAIARKTNFLLFKNEEELFLNEEDPQLEHTILPLKIVLKRMKNFHN